MSDSGFVVGAGRLDRVGQRGVEEFAVGELGQRVGEAFGAHYLEIDLQLVDFLLRGAQPRFELGVRLFHFLGGGHQALDDHPQAFAVLGLAELLGGIGDVFGIMRSGAGGGVDHRHDLLDLAHDLVADLVDLFRQAGGGEIGLVDLLEVGVAEQRPFP